MKKTIKHFIGGLKGAIIMLFTFLLFPFARLFLWNKKIWIVTEFGYEARDNGYIFFKYMRENHKEDNCYYAISFDSPDYEKVKVLGNVIRFGSFKHFAYYCAARYLISSKTQGFCPSYYLTLLRKKIHLWGKYVFLQHGITKDDQKFLYKKKAKIDLFICGAKPEYDDISSRYGYKEGEVVYTGFARFDTYHNIETKNQILIMPTWRRNVEGKVFKETEYFKAWNSLINSSELNELLKKNDLIAYFYMHPHFKDCIGYFDETCSNIKIAPFDKVDMQLLVRESKMLITDFSSLAFDFGYMKKPVIYYQFDEKEYFDTHYVKGYFDYRRDGFGQVCNLFSQVVDSIAYIIKNNFDISKEVSTNIERFYQLYDTDNSLRIFSSIISLNNKQ